MAKYPKFLIAKNPMAEPEGMYILHTQKPRFLAKVDRNLFEVVDDIDEMLTYYKGNADKVQGLIKRMTDWYITYKIYEHENR